jgi:cell division protease FtsH
MNLLTNGATGDIQQATRLARAMVMEWGMSDKLGRVRYQSNEQEVFLGHAVTQSTHMSDETAKLIDAEIRGLIEDGERTAREILTEHTEELHIVAKGLLEFETLSGDEVKDLLDGKPPVREAVMGEPSVPRASPVPSTGRGRPKPGPDPSLEPQPQA